MSSLRLVCQHHPKILYPDDGTVRIVMWTHEPRELLDDSIQTQPVTVDTIDTDYDRVTVSRSITPGSSDSKDSTTAGAPLTTLSPNAPPVRKTKISHPGLTRKDFLLAWEIDALTGNPA